MKIKTSPLPLFLLISAAAFVCLPSLLQGSTVIYSNNFNSSASDWTDNFVKQNAAATTYSWGSAAGVNGTGGISVSGAPSTAYYDEALSGFSSLNKAYILSTYFRGYPATGSATGIRLGLASDTSAPLIASGAIDSTYLSLGLSASASGYQWAYRSKSGTAVQTQNTGSDLIALTNNNWYKMEITLTFDSSSNGFLAVGSLWDYGATGIDSPSLVSTANLGSIVNAGIAADSSIYAGFITGAEGGGGSKALDNFVVAVPEPGAVALLGFAAVSLFLVYRGRRSRTCV